MSPTVPQIVWIPLQLQPEHRLCRPGEGQGAHGEQGQEQIRGHLLPRRDASGAQVSFSLSLSLSLSLARSLSLSLPHIVLLRNGGYINANWVKQKPLQNRIIAAQVSPLSLWKYRNPRVFQAPLEHTIFDFWRMVLENDVVTVLMLCSFIENGTVTVVCVRY